MHQISRRKLLASSATAAMSAPVSGAVQDEIPNSDRGRVVAAGMTDAEADCWELAAKTAGKYFELPELHPTDRQEIATAIHIIQNKLLSRPTYRRYLELARAAEKK